MTVRGVFVERMPGRHGGAPRPPGDRSDECREHRVPGPGKRRARHERRRGATRRPPTPPRREGRPTATLRRATAARSVADRATTKSAKVRVARPTRGDRHRATATSRTTVRTTAVPADREIAERTVPTSPPTTGIAAIAGKRNAAAGARPPRTIAARPSAATGPAALRPDVPLGRGRRRAGPASEAAARSRRAAEPAGSSGVSLCLPRPPSDRSSP